MKEHFAYLMREVFFMFGLIGGPLIAFSGILSLIAVFGDDVTLTQILIYPVIAFMLLAFAGVCLQILPYQMHRFWFLIACLCHMYLGISGITGDDYYAIALGLILLSYSYWEFDVFIRPRWPPPQISYPNPS